MSFEVVARRVSRGTSLKGKPKTGIYDGQKWWNVFGHGNIQAGETAVLKPSGIANWYEFEFAAEQVSGKQYGSSQNGAQQANKQEPIPTPQPAPKLTFEQVQAAYRQVTFDLADWGVASPRGFEAIAMVAQSVILGMRQGEIAPPKPQADPDNDGKEEAPWER